MSDINIKLTLRSVPRKLANYYMTMKGIKMNCKNDNQNFVGI